MTINPSTPWHKASFEQFISDRLPQLLAERLPLAGYSVTEDSPQTCHIQIELSGGVQAGYPAIPSPDDSGIFYLDGEPRIVIPTVSDHPLDAAEVACVGEQLFSHILDQLGQASNGVAWDNEILRAWLPLDRWLNEFLQAKSQRLDTTNWLSRHTHLRRLIIPTRGALSGTARVVAPEEKGRVCPFETPEGPYIGRIFTVAIGAEIRGGRLIVVDERPEAGLGLSASMLPFLENNDPNRLLMAANMMRQAIVPNHPEPAWVQTGNEPDAPDFWCGRSLLTAFIAWGPGVSEDGIILSESAARRMNDPFPVEPGDKISNRHGAKGVVSYILPDDQMPHLPDGTPVELIYNFPGLRTRMHIGQVREAVMSRIARLDGAPAIVPPFHAPAPNELRQRLIQAGLPETGMETLLRGKNGAPLERPSAIGWVYWSRLAHLVKDKIWATVDQSRDQILSEPEYTTLRNLGAISNLREALNTRSSRRPDAAALAQRAAKGKIAQAGFPSPMFTDLASRLQAAGIHAELTDGQLTFGFAPPNGETLELARPMPHPWLHERLLSAVGMLEGEKSSPEAAQLVEANARLARMLSSRVPERLAREAEIRLESTLNAYFEALLPPEVLRFEEPQLFSGRSVAAPGVDLHLDQVGFPEELCWKLFGPLVVRELKGEALAHPDNPQAVQILDEILSRSWLVIYRAPALSPTAMLAFHPVRDPSRAIRLNPVVCRWMNTDFDGDQVAFYLPLTDGGQQEAKELLSVAGHLAHDPSLVKTLLPSAEVIWGLAYRSLNPDGRKEIAEILEIEDTAFGAVLTQGAIADLLEMTLSRKGIPSTLETLERLVRYGYEAAQASGASLSPFIGGSLKLSPPPDGNDPAQWEAYTDELTEQILASTDYLSLDLGPQLLDARARPWARRTLHMVVGVRGVTTDASGKPVVVRRNYAQGLTPDEMVAGVAGARQGFAQLNVQNDQILGDVLKRSDPASLNVLARARRAKRPGIVFARAAASGEVDRLEDVDGRLLVGLG